MASGLAALVGGAVVLDPDPDGQRGPWRTYRHVLETTPPDATHRMVIQDDAEPCDGFVDAMTAAVEAQPDRLVAFFVGGRPSEHARAVMNACSRDLAWAQLDYMRWCPVVATCWPAAMIEPFLGFVDQQRWPNRFQADDEIVGRWLRTIRERPLATVPSLVQHRDLVPSLKNGRRAQGGQDPGRVAACFVGDCDDCDPAAIDWSAGP